MAIDMPTFVGSSYTSTAANLGDWGGLDINAQNKFAAVAHAFEPPVRAGLMPRRIPAHQIGQPQPMEDKVTARIVKVFIVDPDENVPLNKRILFQGDEELTDATDQELFFQINLKELLDKHNEYRATLTDKKVKERVEKLEPAKIRDLKMLVTQIAAF